MKSIFLFGPFIGSLSWEFYRFAPYAIFMKKIYPRIQIAVLTRPDRFDLYGQYVDFLVPLNIENDKVENQICFKLKDYDIPTYNRIASQFQSMYKKRTHVENHFYPDIVDYRYKVRWQFPRLKMDYDFRPRNKNIEVIKNELSRKTFILITPPYNTNLINKLTSCISRHRLFKKYLFLTYGDVGDRFFQNVENIPIDNNTSKIGYLIDIIKKSKIVIGPMSNFTHLSLLLKRPIITWGNTSNINLMNPYGIKSIVCNNVPIESIEKILIQELGKKKKNETDYNCF